MMEDYLLLTKAKISIDICKILSLGDSSSAFKPLTIAFALADHPFSPNKKNDLEDDFSRLFGRRYSIAKEEICLYYQVFDEMLLSSLISYTANLYSIQKRVSTESFNKPKTELIKRLLSLPDGDFARLIVRYV